MTGNFQCAVEAVIEKEGKILVTKRGSNRDHKPNEWEMITGRVNQGESFLEALHREVREETQLEIVPVMLIDTFHFYRGSKKIEMVGVSYWCKWVSGEVVLEPTEQVAYRWVTPEEGLEIIKVENIKNSIRSYMKMTKVANEVNVNNIANEFQKYPFGKLGKGAWCDKCAKFADRGNTCEMIGIKDNQLLLIKRGIEPSKGLWALPGGYVDWDETIEMAAKREFSEETGMNISGEITLVGIYSDPNRSNDHKQNIGHCFYGQVDKGEAKADGQETLEVKWFEMNNLPPMAFDHKKMVEDYIKHFTSKKVGVYG